MQHKGAGRAVREGRALAVPGRIALRGLGLSELGGVIAFGREAQQEICQPASTAPHAAVERGCGRREDISIVENPPEIRRTILTRTMHELEFALSTDRPDVPSRAVEDAELVRASVDEGDRTVRQPPGSPDPREHVRRRPLEDADLQQRRLAQRPPLGLSPGGSPVLDDANAGAIPDYAPGGGLRVRQPAGRDGEECHGEAEPDPAVHVARG